MAKLGNQTILISILASLVVHAGVVSLVGWGWSSSEQSTVYELHVISNPEGSTSSENTKKLPVPKLPKPKLNPSSNNKPATNTTETAESHTSEEYAESGESTPTSSTSYGVNELDHPPRLRKEIKANYPAEAKARLLEGHVLFELIVGADGVPRDIKLVSSSNSIFEASAWQAVEQLRFHPGIKENKFVPVKINYRSSFVLK